MCVRACVCVRVCVCVHGGVAFLCWLVDGCAKLQVIMLRRAVSHQSLGTLYHVRGVLGGHSHSSLTAADMYLMNGGCEVCHHISECFVGSKLSLCMKVVVS